MWDYVGIVRTRTTVACAASYHALHQEMMIPTLSHSILVELRNRLVSELIVAVPWTQGSRGCTPRWIILIYRKLAATILTA